MIHRFPAIQHPLVLALLVFLVPQVVLAAPETQVGEPQKIILKLDDVVAQSSSKAAPVSPGWQRVTDFQIIDYLKSKGCVFVTPSEYKKSLE